MIDPITQYILTESSFIQGNLEQVKAVLVKKYGLSGNEDWLEDSAQEIIDLRDSMKKLEKAVDSLPSPEQAFQAIKKVLDDSEVSKGSEEVIKTITNNADASGASFTIFPLIMTAVISGFLYKIYKRFLTQAARACRGKSGDVKTLCMIQYKKKAYIEQIKQLKKIKQYCKHSKNKHKCEKKVNSKIIKVGKKMQKIL